jgi:hypothetical protein
MLVVDRAKFKSDILVDLSGALEWVRVAYGSERWYTEFISALRQWICSPAEPSIGDLYKSVVKIELGIGFSKGGRDGRDEVKLVNDIFAGKYKEFII